MLVHYVREVLSELDMCMINAFVRRVIESKKVGHHPPDDARLRFDEPAVAIRLRLPSSGTVFLQLAFGFL